MPSSSDMQHNAMEAAAHGHSTLGIPKSVGQDFVAADKGKKFSAKAIVKALRKKRQVPENMDGGMGGGGMTGGGMPGMGM